MFPINWFKVGAIVAAFVFALGLWWTIQRFINDRDAALLENGILKVQAVQKDAKITTLRDKLNLTVEYNDKHLRVVEETNAEIVGTLKKAIVTIQAGELQQRASTVEGRADLDRRAAERTRQIYDEMEKLSDWNDVYEEPIASPAN